jgi:hypothetical protein
MARNDMTGIFRDLNANRREREAAQNQWGVFPLGANGKPLKRASLEARTEQEATIAAERMTVLNAGKTFIVRELA